MDLEKFESSITEIMEKLGTIDLNRTDFPDLSKEVARLRSQIEDAIQEGKTGDDLQGLKDILDQMSAFFTDPKSALQDIQDKAARYQPQPELYDAIENRDLDEVRKCLKKYDVNQPFGKHNSTPLYHAMSCMFGVSLEVIDLLLDAGADPRQGLTDSNVLHGLGFANLDRMDVQKIAGMINRCVELGADLEQRTPVLGWTPLIYAASEWNSIATEALLIAGADIAAKTAVTRGVYGAGSDCFVFAQGDAATTAVLKKYSGIPE